MKQNNFNLMDELERVYLTIAPHIGLLVGGLSRKKTSKRTLIELSAALKIAADQVDELLRKL